MGNLCAGVRNTELGIENAQEIFQIALDEIYITIVQGNIKETNSECILNASLNPYSNEIAQQCRIRGEELILGQPNLINLPKGFVKSKYMMNLKIDFEEFSNQDLIESFELCFEKLYIKEIGSISYYDQCEGFSRNIQLINCECFVEALINQLQNNRCQRRIEIFHPDINVCYMYKNEFKNQYSQYCKSKYRMIEQSNFMYGDILQTINEELTEKDSQQPQSLIKLFSKCQNQEEEKSCSEVWKTQPN